MIVATFALSAVAAIQASPPPDRKVSSGTDIVVTAQMSRDARAVARQVDAIAPPMSLDQPLARFTGPVCPGVAGLPRAGAQVIVERIAAVAADLGLGVGVEGCAPNLLVIVTADGRAALSRIASRRPANVRAQTLADLRRIAGEPGPARAWVETEVRSRDGEAAVRDPGAPPVLNVPNAGRINLGFRRDVVSATVLIDTAAVPGRSLVQIADYAAMRGLADARPNARAGVNTILSAFTPDRDAGTPQELTAFDRGFLEGLYAGQGNVASGTKRAGITARIVRDAQPRDQHR